MTRCEEVSDTFSERGARSASSHSREF